MTLMSIKRLKKSNLIEKLIYFDFVNLFQSLSIYFQSLLIDFKLFDQLRIWINQICRDDYFGFQELGSKIKLKYDSNLIKTDYNSQIDSIDENVNTNPRKVFVTFSVIFFVVIFIRLLVLSVK